MARENQRQLKETEQQGNSNAMNSVSRWWEYYLVRYFVGTIFGTLIILFIVFNSKFYSGLFGNGLFDDGKFEMSYLWLFLLIGLAFCYLASSPVLVFHAYRSTIFYKRKIYRSEISVLKRIGIGICRGKWRWLYLAYFAIPVIPLTFNLSIINKWTIMITIVIFLLQALLVTIDILTEKVVIYYKDLTAKRANNSKEGSEYIESYRHLREHGNAFLIILFEILLGVVLFHVSSLNELIFVLLCWITPASLVWFLGNELESHL